MAETVVNWAKTAASAFRLRRFSEEWMAFGMRGDCFLSNRDPYVMGVSHCVNQHGFFKIQINEVSCLVMVLKKKCGFFLVLVAEF